MNAIVFSGHYRTFDITKKRLKKFIDINSLDVYCHLWDATEDQLQDVQETLSPKKILSELSADYELQCVEASNRIKVANPKPNGIDTIERQLSMHLGMKKSYDLIDKEYELIIRGRYDLMIYLPFVFDDLEMEKGISTPIVESYNIISDIFAIFPPSHADSYFIYDYLEELHSTPFAEDFTEYMLNRGYDTESMRIQTYERYCPHMALLRHMFRKKINQREVNFPLFLQR